MESDLLPIGQRVAPSEIDSGLIREIELIYNGQVRHLPLVTIQGFKAIYAPKDSTSNE